MNILQISEYLKGVPEQFLRKEANPSTTSGRYPAFLLISEMNRRNTMSKQFAGIAAQQNQPQETVADRVVRETNPEPTQIASLQGLKSPQTTYQEEPSGQETMGIPGAVRMFEGGRVSFQAGLSTDPRQRLDELNKELAKAQANPKLYGLGNLKNLREQIAAAEQQIMMQDPEVVRGMGMGLRTIEEIQADINKAKTNPRLYGIGTIQNLEKELEQRKPVEDKFGVDLSKPEFQQPSGFAGAAIDLDPTGPEGLAVGMRKDVVGKKTASDETLGTGEGTGEGEHVINDKGEAVPTREQTKELLEHLKVLAELHDNSKDVAVRSALKYVFANLG